MLVAGQWIAWGALGSASIVAAAAVMTTPPPVTPTTPAAVVASVAQPARIAPSAEPVAGDPCAKTAWPMTEGCAVTAPSGAVRVIPVSAAGKGPELVHPVGPVVLRRVVPVAPAPVATAASSAPPAATAARASRTANEGRPGKAAKVAKRQGAGGTVRQARRGPVVRVSLCRSELCGARLAPAAPPAPRDPFAVIFGR